MPHFFHTGAQLAPPVRCPSPPTTVLYCSTVPYSTVQYVHSFRADFLRLSPWQHEDRPVPCKALPRAWETSWFSVSTSDSCRPTPLLATQPTFRPSGTLAAGTDQSAYPCVESTCTSLLLNHFISFRHQNTTSNGTSSSAWQHCCGSCSR